MKSVSFLHQKGGTGKSTLAISSAIALARQEEGVLLMDADYQGTSSEWGNRFGINFKVETRSQVQPILHKEAERFRRSVSWMVIDGPPSLTPMTESILKASNRVIIPVRPSFPDIWALPWLAAIIKKLKKEGGSALQPLVVFNMVRDEDLEPLREEIAKLGLPVHPRHIPAHPGFQQVFSGQPLPDELSQMVLELLEY